MPTKIFLDTNVLMAIGQFKIDVFTRISEICRFPHEFIVISPVVEELEKIIATRKGSNKRNAKLALEILARKKLKVIRSVMEADEALLELTGKWKGVIATQDAKLRKEARAKGIALLVMRQKKYFSLFGC